MDADWDKLIAERIAAMPPPCEHEFGGWREFEDHRGMEGSPMRKRPANVAERAHMDRVAQMPCLVSGERPVTLHHCTGYADRMGRLPRSHRLIVPLAARFHLIQHGPIYSVEALSHRGFFRVHGIDLLAEAKRLEAESVAMGVLSDG